MANLFSWRSKPWQEDAAKALRVLACEMITKAKSGHPGMPLGMADVMSVLYGYFVKHNPLNPSWINRDRVILSSGHGSAVLYAALHLAGYPISLEDLKQFRQLNSITPGHPEYGVTPGVEASSGPLGQGVANAVGMALAARTLASEFNRPHFNLIDHYVYVIAGDGCLMEGVSYEALSLAGTQRLERLILLYDSNGISIDGKVTKWFDEDVAKRFEAMHWRVIKVDGHNAKKIYAALKKAQQLASRPTIIICRTIIGKYSDLAGSEKVHGSPLSIASLEQLKTSLSWPYTAWQVPNSAKSFLDVTYTGAAAEKAWQQQFNRYQKKYPNLAKRLIKRLNLHNELEKICSTVNATVAKDATFKELANNGAATRQLSQVILAYYQKALGSALLGGSADLANSNLVFTKFSKPVNKTHPLGNYIYYGVREFGMAAIMNGIALYGGFIPFGSTFLVFIEYALAAVRMAAMMRLKVIYILTHDSFMVGEDGPTHQPVEHLTMLRSMPNLELWRPSGAVETLAAYQEAFLSPKVAALILSRQKIPALTHLKIDTRDVAKGGYILYECGEASKQIVLVATGSEVALSYQAAEVLTTKHHLAVRVVSIPCLERFRDQEADYQAAVLLNVNQRLIVEAGSSLGWRGLGAAVLGLDQFGKSAKAEDLVQHLGFSVECVVAAALEVARKL